VYYLREENGLPDDFRFLLTVEGVHVGSGVHLRLPRMRPALRALRRE
jgi:hypothetical protein